MADERTLARRYGKALLDVAIERNVVDQVEDDLYNVAAVWRDSRDFRTVVAHPSIVREVKRGAIRKAFEGRVAELTLSFIELLLDKGRLDIIEDIAVEYDKVSDEVQDVAKLKVTTFMPLTDAQREKLKGMLLKYTGRGKAVMEEAVDPTILGGILVRFGDRVIDGSIAGKLRRLRERMILREDERAQQAAANAAEALRV